MINTIKLVQWENLLHCHVTLWTEHISLEPSEKTGPWDWEVMVGTGH